MKLIAILNSNVRISLKRLHSTSLQSSQWRLVISSNYFGRLFESYGHTVKLIPAQHVKPFVRGNKNDANDAIAIAEAVQRPNISFVKVIPITKRFHSLAQPLVPILLTLLLSLEKLTQASVTASRISL